MGEQEVCAYEYDDGGWGGCEGVDYGCLVLVPAQRKVCNVADCQKRIISSVPVSKLPELVYETKKDLKEHGLKSTIVGHVGDGNFHALILFHKDDELPHVSDAVHRLVHRAIALDGTCKSHSPSSPTSAEDLDVF